MRLLYSWMLLLVFREIQKFITQKSARLEALDKPRHVLFSVADHFEPGWRKPGFDVETARVDRWVQEYPEISKQHVDYDGRHPKHTFFYPEEEYHEEHLKKLSELCHRGFGEVEVHLHHENDTADKLRKKLIKFKETLYREHGVLSKNKETGEISYGFIHGNWALENARSDDKFCGVDNELVVLKETGCYADFTFPSAPDETQPKKINSIYYAKSNPFRLRSYDSGYDIRVGGNQWGDLMLIQGPLCLNWVRRKWSFMPRLENGALMYNSPPTPDRIGLWIKQNIHIIGKSNISFVKVYTHGCQEKNMSMLLSKGLNCMFSFLEDNFNDGERFVLHYVSCREMYNVIKALEAGELNKTNDVAKYYNYKIEEQYGNEK